ncbi:MAG TPA: DUF3592 domain-containing protein [Phototrophicaceae bacterium]|jgi:hypothetical protein|nr:DUF3592 domain-containing protein [Phototrophicaceae bacterium]
MSFLKTLGANTALITAVPFVLIALFLAYRAYMGQRQVRASQNWMVATGKVLAANVEARTSRSGTSGRSTSYYPNVVYEYQVNGQRYQNNRFYLGMQVGRGNYMTIQQRINNYPVGSSVQVYYDPNNPAQSVLERTSPGSRVLVFAVIFIIVILVVTIGFTMGAMNMVNQMISNVVPRR